MGVRYRTLWSRPCLGDRRGAGEAGAHAALAEDANGTVLLALAEHGWRVAGRGPAAGRNQPRQYRGGTRRACSRGIAIPDMDLTVVRAILAGIHSTLL